MFENRALAGRLCQSAGLLESLQLSTSVATCLSTFRVIGQSRNRWTHTSTPDPAGPDDSNEFLLWSRTWRDEWH